MRKSVHAKQKETQQRGKARVCRKQDYDEGHRGRPIYCAATAAFVVVGPFWITCASPVMSFSLYNTQTTRAI